MEIVRPYPSEILLEANPDEIFYAAPDLHDFVWATFLNPESRLYNPDHDHLRSAILGFQWTNVANRKGMREIVGQAELPTIQGDRWKRGRYNQQLREFYGTSEIDFLITIFAPYAAECSPAQFCALLDHELYHCAQKLDAFGFPKFHKDSGLPMFGLRAHDCEEFVGIVRRYGVGAAAGGTAQLVEAAQRMPEIEDADIAALCGTCR